MAASHVQVAPDSTGKDVDADALTSSEAGTPTVYRQDFVVASPTTYANKAEVTAGGSLQVTQTTSLPAGTNTLGRVGPQGSTTGTITTATPAATSGTLLASNANRLGGAVTNDSNVDALVSLSSSATSTTAYTVRVPAGGYYELPGTNCVYTGALTFLGVVGTTATAAGSGACRVTELT